MNREEAVAAISADGKKTPEQAEAFLDILGSAFRRRGWVDGEPLTQEQIGERVGAFLIGRAKELTDRRTEIIEIVSDSMRDLDHNGLGRCYGGAPTTDVGAAVAALLMPKFEALLDRLTAATEVEQAFREVMALFYEVGHPGYPAARTCWVDDEQVQAWRALARGIRVDPVDAPAPKESAE